MSHVLTAQEIESIKEELDGYEFPSELDNIIASMVDSPLEIFEEIAENQDFSGLEDYDNISRNAIWNSELVQLASGSVDYELTEPYMFQEKLNGKETVEEIMVKLGNCIVNEIVYVVSGEVARVVEEVTGINPLSDVEELEFS